MSNRETFEEATRRELREETGFAPAELGPCLFAEDRLIRRPDRDLLYRMRFFLAHAGTGEVSLHGLDAVERGFYRDHRWWTLAELETTAETLFPAELPAILRRALDLPLATAGEPDTATEPDSL